MYGITSPQHITKLNTELMTNNFPYETYNELKEALTHKKNMFDDTIPVTQAEFDMYASYLAADQQELPLTFEGFTLVVE